MGKASELYQWVFAQVEANEENTRLTRDQGRKEYYQGRVSAFLRLLLFLKEFRASDPCLLCGKARRKTQE
jgi:hypothetical protein